MRKHTMPIKQLKLSQIRIDGGTQSREKLNQQAIKEYTETIQEHGSDLFPAVEVVYDGQDYWLWEGFHRYHSHQKAGLGIIRCNVEKGTLDDAILKAAGANATHGLRRTNADKRHAVKMLLQHPKFVTLSDRAIAEAVGVSHTLISKVRSVLATVANTNGTRTGQDGRQYKAKKKTKFDKLREQFPELSEAHLQAAQKWQDAEEYLTWADELQATVKEMEAYRRIQRGEPSPEPAPEPASPVSLSPTGEADLSGDTDFMDEEDIDAEFSEPQPLAREVDWTTRSLHVAEQIRRLFSDWPQGARILIEEVLYDLSKEDHTQW